MSRTTYHPAAQHSNGSKDTSKKNILVLGASGSVANAVLLHLIHYRELFGKVILLDQSDNLLFNPRLDHKKLRYIFVRKTLNLPAEEEDFLQLLQEHAVDIVLDLTDLESLPILAAANKMGVSYVNTAMNSNRQTTDETIYDIYPRRDRFNNAAHILSTGMNPGVVNMWVQHGIENHGLPHEVIHFEYDNSTDRKRWKPTLSWSVYQFLLESVIMPSAIVLGRNRTKTFFPNALKNRVDMTPILAPIANLSRYPYGLQVLHEENITIAQRYDVPSKFIYAINMKTMDYLTKTYERKSKVDLHDMIHGDNFSTLLNGFDMIGVLLEYKNQKVYYMNTAHNLTTTGTNATCMQVAVGIFAALFTLIFGQLPPKAYFSEELSHTVFKQYVFEHMQVEEYVFKKRGPSLALARYMPAVHVAGKEKVHAFYDHRYAKKFVVL